MRPASRDWPIAATLALFGAGWLVLAWPWLSGRVTIPWDAKAHFYPQLQFLAQTLHRGESPFWTPFVFSGHPQVADPQSLIFSPYLLLAWADPDPSLRAADALVLAMLGLGGAALILFFRDRGWHPAGALVAALGFAFGASAAWRLQHIGEVMSLSYLPVGLWCLARALERGSPVGGLLAGVAAGLMALGRDQVAYLGLWALAGFVLWSWAAAPARGRALRTSLVPLLLGALAGAVIVAIPLTLTVLLSEASNRPAIDLAGAGQGSLHPALLLTAAIPNLFGADGPFVDYWGPPSPRWGAVDLFLARNMGVLYAGALTALAVAAGALRGVLWAREIRFFTVAAALALLYALGRYAPFFGAAFAVVPGIDLFRRPADATFLFGGLAAILAGYAVHRRMSDPPPLILPREGRADSGEARARWGGTSTSNVGAAAPPRSHRDSALPSRGGSKRRAAAPPRSADADSALPSQGGSKRRAAVAGCALVFLPFAAALGLALAKETLSIAAWPLATAALWLAAALGLFRLLPRLRARGSGLAAVAVAGFMSADLALNNGPNESTALPPAMYEVLRPDSRSPLLAAMKARLAETAAPDRLDRVELTGLGFHWPNASLAHRLHNVLGYNPVRLALYSAATGAEDHVALPEQRKFSALFPSYRSTLADLLGLRLVATGVPVERIDPKLAPGDLALVGSFPDGFLYENPRALPRVLFASRAESADFDAILRSGAWPPVDFSTTVLLSDAPSLPAAPQPSLGDSTVRIVHYGDTEIEIEAEGASAGYLVLNDPYHPWWRASVDGAEAPILRANVLFRAVAVPAGRHTVRFKFRPLLGAWEQLRRR